MFAPPAAEYNVPAGATTESPPSAPNTNARESRCTNAARLATMGERLTTATVDAATSAVELCLGLIGFMALWLGLMNIAKDAGLVDAFARLLRPLMRIVFPEIPAGHPAMGAVLMNLSANMLGLNNAATPLGLKAMQELQDLNPVKDTATNSMAMFLAINTSSITLIPMTVIGYRVLTGSKNPAEPIAGTLLATLFSTIVAIFVTRWLSRRRRFRIDEGTSDVGGRLAPAIADKGLAAMSSIQQTLDVISQWAIPMTVLLIVVWAAIKRVPMYDSFVTGAKEGFGIAVMIIPYLVAMLFVIKVFLASGIFDDIKMRPAIGDAMGRPRQLHRLARPVAVGFHEAAHGQRLQCDAARDFRICTAQTASLATRPRS